MNDKILIIVILAIVSVAVARYSMQGIGYSLNQYYDSQLRRGRRSRVRFDSLGE